VLPSIHGPTPTRGHQGVVGTADQGQLQEATPSDAALHVALRACRGFNARQLVSSFGPGMELGR